MRRWTLSVLVGLLSAGTFLLFCSLLPAPEQISLEHTIPGSILNEEEKEFTLTLNKGTLIGPARINIEIRKSGIDINAIELSGAELLKEGDIHSIVWTELPASPAINLKLRLKGHRFFTGIFTVLVSFSYIEEGSSREKELARKELRVISSGKSQSTASTGTKTGTTTSTSGGTSNTTTTGTTTTGSTTTGSTTTNENSTGTTSGNTGTSNTTTSTSTGNTGTTGTVTENKTMIDPITKKAGTPIRDASTIPGLFFRVQVAASHFLVTQEYFTDRYKFDEQLYVDNVDGWVKYTVGDFKTVEEALAKKATLVSFPFKGPFLVAFNDGKRIPIYSARQLSTFK